jgi:hypothetical protein
MPQLVSVLAQDVERRLAVAGEVEPHSKAGKPYVPVEIPVPKRRTWDRLLHPAENTPPPKD